jgi:hypothetical protein
MFRFNRRPDICVSNLRIWIERDRIMAISGKRQIVELRIGNITLEFKRVSGLNWAPYPTINTELIISEIIEFQLLGCVHENNSV